MSNFATSNTRDDAIHLARAPIVEAVLDIQVKLGDRVNADNFAPLEKRFKHGYPSKLILKNWQSEFTFVVNAAPVTKATEGFGGLRFTSSDGKEVVQARLNGFSFSRLSPYTDWKQFSVAARNAWTEYAKVLKPVSVQRIALRYINRIELPLPVADLSDYFKSVPRVAESLPLELQTFFFRAVSQQAEEKANVILTQTVEESKPGAESVPFIFDVDVYRLGKFPTAVDALWPLFGPLRDLKNLVFFDSLTPAALELLK